jgi:Flp pilus assembly protein TadB
MARPKPDRGGPLTPEQAIKGRRAIRRGLTIAVAQMWVLVVVIALFVPHLLVVALVLVVAYTASMPVVLRLVERGIDRRTVGGSDPARESFGRS